MEIVELCSKFAINRYNEDVRTMIDQKGFDRVCEGRQGSLAMSIVACCCVLPLRPSKEETNPLRRSKLSCLFVGVNETEMEFKSCWIKPKN